ARVLLARLALFALSFLALVPLFALTGITHSVFRSRLIAFLAFIPLTGFHGTIAFFGLVLGFVATRTWLHVVLILTLVHLRIFSLGNLILLGLLQSFFGGFA